MNRTPILFDSDKSNTLPPPTAEPIGVNRSFSLPAKFPAYPETSSGFSSFAPARYESGYAYPLIIWLHSQDSDQYEVQRAMPHVSTQNFVAAAVHGNCRSRRFENAYSWGTTPDKTADAAGKVERCIANAKVLFNVHADRIFLAGSSTGGTLALRLAMEYPGICAGAISLGGRLPRGSRPLRRINEARKTPLMLAVSPCESYSLDNVMEDLSLLHGAGFPLDLQLYPEGDDVTTVMLAHVNKWIMKQICPESVSVEC